MDEILAFERRFRRAGLPLFIEGYSATQDVFTRALPFLALVFLVTTFGALNLEWSPVANVLAFFGGIAVLHGLFGVLNVLRGRPFASIPRKVGLPELIAFVLLPAILPLVFGGQLLSSLVTVLQQGVVLLLAYLTVGFSLLSIVRWAGARLFRQLGTSLRLLARAIPLLLFFSLVVFLTTETWQAFSSMPTAFLFVALGLLLALGTVFLVARLPQEVARLEREVGPEQRGLRASQRANVGLVLFVSQALQILVVSLGVAAFFIAFGALLVGPGVREAWLGTSGHVLIEFGLLGHPVQITEELVRVSGAIAAFSGVYYAIATLTDAVYRQEFLDEITVDMQAIFAARAEYLRLLRSQETAPTGS